MSFYWRIGKKRFKRGGLNFKKIIIFASVVVLFTAAAGLSMAAQPRQLSGPVRVVDGDTLALAENKIRLMGIDAPEKKQQCRIRTPHRLSAPYPCGLRATKWLAVKTKNKTVICKITAKDRWGRLIGTCTVAGEKSSLNSQLVSRGWAVAYKKYSKKYIAEEAAAKQARRGIWAGPFERPEQWRRNQKRKRNRSKTTGTTGTSEAGKSALPKGHLFGKKTLTGRLLHQTTSNSFIMAKDYGLGFERYSVVLKGVKSVPPLNNPDHFRRAKALLHRATSNRQVFCEIEKVLHVAPPNTMANQSPFLGQVLAVCSVGCEDVRPSPGLKWKLPAPVCGPGENRLNLGRWLKKMGVGAIGRRYETQ